MPRKPKFHQLELDVFDKTSSGTETVYLEQDEVTTMMKDVHHMVRRVSVATLPEVEQHLREWFDKGYELFQVFYLGMEEAGAIYDILYVLVKRE